MNEIVKEEKLMDLNRRFNREKIKKFQILNGAQLKYIAFLSMLIDHVNNGIVAPLLDGKGALLYISNIFSILGRIAFPIFIFFVVEGFFKTKNTKVQSYTILYNKLYKNKYSINQIYNSYKFNFIWNYCRSSIRYIHFKSVLQSKLEQYNVHISPLPSNGLDNR